MVPGTGIEPVRPYSREILSLLCLPISPSGLRVGIIHSSGSIKLKSKEGKCLSAFSLFDSGAGEESRTLDLYLGKVSLYQLSYSRRNLEARAGVEPTYTDLQSGA
jgi:hypothetical protein